MTERRRTVFEIAADHSIAHVDQSAKLTVEEAQVLALSHIGQAMHRIADSLGYLDRNFALLADAIREAGSSASPDVVGDRVFEGLGEIGDSLDRLAMAVRSEAAKE